MKTFSYIILAALIVLSGPYTSSRTWAYTLEECVECHREGPATHLAVALSFDPTDVDVGHLGARITFCHFQAKLESGDHHTSQCTDIQVDLLNAGCAIGLHRLLNDVKDIQRDGHFMHGGSRLNLSIDQLAK